MHLPRKLRRLTVDSSVSRRHFLDGCMPYRFQLHFTSNNHTLYLHRVLFNSIHTNCCVYTPVWNVVEASTQPLTGVYVCAYSRLQHSVEWGPRRDDSFELYGDVMASMQHTTKCEAHMEVARLPRLLYPQPLRQHAMAAAWAARRLGRQAR